MALRRKKKTTDIQARFLKAMANGKLQARMAHVRKAYFTKQIGTPMSAEEDTKRARNTAMRRNSLNQLSDLLTAFEGQAKSNGVEVHWAETPEDAHTLIRSLTLDHVTDDSPLFVQPAPILHEIELNQFLKERYINTITTHLGGYYTQLQNLDSDHPVHFGMHATQDQLLKVVGKALTDDHTIEATEDGKIKDIEMLSRAYTTAIERSINDTSIFLTGVNFVIKDTGQLCIAHSSDTARAVASRCHTLIAVVGLEQVLHSIEDLPAMISAWSEKALGKAMPPSLNLVGGPKQFGQLDGPENVHVILLDNDRSITWEDDELRQRLQCIQCGACHFTCPVTNAVGSQAYPSSQTGPNGAIMHAVQQGLSASHQLIHASSLCGLCQDGCPVDVPIPYLLQRLRRDTVNPVKDNQVPLPDQGFAESDRDEKRLKRAIQIVQSPFLSNLFNGIWKRYPNAFSQWQLPNRRLLSQWHNDRKIED